jgi:4-alpha-glucanotransferase
VKLPHASGVQLHPTSLPDGRLGPSAYAFVDWLADAGQSVWQMLPLTPPDRYGSPYKSASAFAAWGGLLADPDADVSDGEVAAFRDRHAFWAPGWEAYGGDLRDQVRFEREWSALREHAEARGVALMGDVPIYVAPDSADQRTWPGYFRDDAVAGVPPDVYAETGQLWGNPLYDWPALRADGYEWWIERFRRTFDLFDLVRVDHFRGFVAYWAVPAGAETALEGGWQRGPGRAVFDAAREALGELQVVAEDLGDITPPVIALRRELGLPGMAVLQFAFDPEDPEGTHQPANHEEHQVVYTGTHDSDTVVGWWRELPESHRAMAREAFRTYGVRAGEDEVHWQVIELAAASRARLAMTQVQDVLGLGSEARMNVPGTQGRSWRWRLEPGALTPAHAQRLREVTEAAGRLPG